MRIEPNASAINNLTKPQTAVEPDKGEDFGRMLMDAIKDVNGSQLDARQIQNDLMAGRPVDTHEVMIAMERASTAMALTMQVRNKLLDAYQEISRMNV